MASQPFLSGEIPSTGLTVLVCPPNPTVDIVFVHGFTGDPERTWKLRRGPEQSHNTKRSRFLPGGPSPSSSSSLAQPVTSSGSVFWPRDLLPSAVPDARILTYGYDTRIRHGLSPKNNNTVNYISRDFLVALEAERRPEKERRLVFICHSLGGIVVKELLRQSFGCFSVRTHLRSVYTSTVGILFFGTPHGGADPRSFFHRVVQRIAKGFSVHVDEKIFDELLPSSDRLEELRVEFNPMAEKHHWTIHSFQEGEGVLSLGGKKVVEDVSSYLNLPNETVEHIGKNHMEMCRFSGLADVEYRKVVAALERVISEAAISQKPSEKDDADLSPVDERYRTELLKSLGFEEMDSRHDTIRRAHVKTCEWLVQTNEYTAWLDPSKKSEHHGILWIKGKPGTGKSTLMKFALARATESMKGIMILRFFFHARGTELQKSTFGMYRSLLSQLLGLDSSLLTVFDGPCFKPQGRSIPRNWSIEVLKELFGYAIQACKGKRIVCFLDALDECDESEIRDMISFFEYVSGIALEAQTELSFCFASRHYPHISIKNGISLVVEDQEAHGQDIGAYLDSELRIDHSDLTEEIRNEVLSKSSSVFLWVVLVVRILNKEFDSGQIHALKRRLREIPTDLHSLFRDILTRDSLRRHELILCLQWTLFAKRPLSPREMFMAILSGIPDEEARLSGQETGSTTPGTRDWDVVAIPNANEIDIRRFILDSSKGLVEIIGTQAPKKKVQFIHESVKDYLLWSGGLREIWDGKNNVEGISHDTLRRCCLNYVQTCNLPRPAVGSATQKHFLEYALHNCLRHADDAQAKGVEQMPFLEQFPMQAWIGSINRITKHQTRHFPPSATMAELFAEQNTPHLMSSLTPTWCLNDDEFEHVFARALYASSTQFVSGMLLAAASHDSTLSEYEDVCTHSCYQEIYSEFQRKGTEFPRMKGARVPISRHQLLLRIFSTGRPELCLFFIHRLRKTFARTVVFQYDHIQAAIEQAWDDLVLMVLDWNSGCHPQSLLRRINNCIQPVPVRDLSNWPKTAFEEALTHHQTTLATSIASHYPNDCNHVIYDRNWLASAVEHGTNESVRHILALMNDPTKEFQLCWKFSLEIAIGIPSLAKAKMLIEAGAPINVCLADGRSPLEHALDSGTPELATFLLAAGADVNIRGKYGRTPLHTFAELGHCDLLLDAGADTNAVCEMGRNALSYASGRSISSTTVVHRLIHLTSPAGIDLPDRSGRTPFSYAAETGSAQTLSTLLLTGKVEVNRTDSDGLTAADRFLLSEDAGGRRFHNVFRVLLQVDDLNWNTRPQHCAHILLTFLRMSYRLSKYHYDVKSATSRVVLGLLYANRIDPAIEYRTMDINSSHVPFPSSTILRINPRTVTYEAEQTRYLFREYSRYYKGNGGWRELYMACHSETPEPMIKTEEEFVEWFSWSPSEWETRREDPGR